MQINLKTVLLKPKDSDATTEWLEQCFTDYI